MSIVVWMAESVSPASFATLYERHARDVYRFALALSGNEATAEDLMAEAFLRVWEAGSRVDLLTVRGYLVAIVRNLHRSQWRRDRRRGGMPAELPAPVVDPLARLELQRVLQALGQLRETDRELLLMRAEGGLSYDEIAVLAGGTAEAARLRVHRARKKLMEALCPKA